MMRLRANDPPCLNKGDPNKVWCYETTESATYGKDDDFFVRPEKIYAIEDSDFNQLDFLFNHLMFIFLSSSLMRVIRIRLSLRS